MARNTALDSFLSRPPAPFFLWVASRFVGPLNSWSAAGRLPALRPLVRRPRSGEVQFWVSSSFVGRKIDRTCVTKRRSEPSLHSKSAGEGETGGPGAQAPTSRERAGVQARPL